MAAAVGTTATSTLSVASTSFSVTLPTGVAVGDKLHIYVATSANIKVTATGWTALNAADTFTNGALNILERIADGTEGSTVTATLATSGTGTAIAVRFTGADGAVAAQFSTLVTHGSTASTIDPGAVTPSWGSIAGTLWVGLASSRDSTHAFTGYPSNFANDHITTTGTGAVSMATDNTTGSSADANAFTLASNGASCGYTIGIKPLSVTTSTGTSSAASAVSATGAATNAASASSSAASAVAGVGKATAASAGSIAAASSASGVGAGTDAAKGTIATSSAVAGISAANAAASGSISAVSAVNGAGGQTVASVGAASASSAVSGAGSAIAAATATISAASAVSGQSASSSIVSAVGSISATSDVEGLSGSQPQPVTAPDTHDGVRHVHDEDDNDIARKHREYREKSTKLREAIERASREAEHPPEPIATVAQAEAAPRQPPPEVRAMQAELDRLVAAVAAYELAQQQADDDCIVALLLAA